MVFRDFAAGTSVFTIISLFFPQVYYGFGFLAGCVAFFLFSVLRLDYYTKRLPYYILSVQPVVQEEKTGIFTELGYFLDKKLEGDRSLRKYKSSRIAGSIPGHFDVQRMCYGQRKKQRKSGR